MQDRGGVAEVVTRLSEGPSPVFVGESAPVLQSETDPRPYTWEAGGGERASRRAAGCRIGIMDYDVLGAALAVVGVLLWIHRDLKADIRALNVRIDNILLADRKPS